MYGRKAKVPIDLFYAALNSEENPTIDNYAPALTDQYAIDLNTHLKNIYQKVAKNVEVKMEKAKTLYDRNATNPTFKIGDLVLVHRSKIPKKINKKMTFKWEGPHKILSIFNNMDYKLKRIFSNEHENKKRNKTIMRHYNRLKKYKGEVKEAIQTVKNSNINKISRSTNKKKDATAIKENEENNCSVNQNSQITTTNDVTTTEPSINSGSIQTNALSINGQKRIIKEIQEHRAVKNSFVLKITFSDSEEPQWIKKKDIQHLTIFKDYLNNLPNKSLRENKNDNINKPIESQRRSKRATKQPDKLKY
jgi:hypothetical protein